MNSICVYTICKNEASFIPRWLESVQGADQILICDTGSTDDSLNILYDDRRGNPDVYNLTISPWRFDDARNAVLSLVDPDIDICIALDMDEVLVGDWLSTLRKSNVSRPRYEYTWSWNPDGSKGLTYWGDKIHSRHGYRWKNPVHETLVTDTVETSHFYDSFEIHHFPDSTKSRSSYLHLLEIAVKEDPADTRNVWYLGREYFYNKMFDKSLETLHQYLSLPKTWAPERSAAYRMIGDITREERWYHLALAEAPEYREPWVSLAIWHHDRGNWFDCLFYASKAWQIKEKPKLYICEAHAWGNLPSRLIEIAAEKLS